MTRKALILALFALLPLPVLAAATRIEADRGGGPDLDRLRQAVVIDAGQDAVATPGPQLREVGVPAPTFDLLLG